MCNKYSKYLGKISIQNHIICCFLACVYFIEVMSVDLNITYIDQISLTDG